MERKLYRSLNNRILLGVCGGIGEYFNIDPVIIRVIAVILLIAGVFPAIIAYFILALIIPLKGSTANTPEESVRENISDMKETTANLGEEIRTTFSSKDKVPEATDESRQASSSSGSHTTSSRTLYILGLIILAIGIFFILVNIFGWFWHYFWPVLLIIVGLIIIVLVARRR
jgi:phage shock protein C